MEKTQEPRLLSVLTGLRAIAAYFVCYSTMDRASPTRRGRVLVVAHGAHYGDPRMANAFSAGNTQQAFRGKLPLRKGRTLVAATDRAVQTCPFHVTYRDKEACVGSGGGTNRHVHSGESSSIPIFGG
jgi:hypothetical protein